MARYDQKHGPLILDDISSGCVEFIHKFEGIEVIQVMNAKVKIYILVLLGESDFKMNVNIFTAHSSYPIYVLKALARSQLMLNCPMILLYDIQLFQLLVGA